MDTIPRAFCNPACKFPSGERILVPVPVMEAVGNIIGETTVPDENRQIPA